VKAGQFIIIFNYIKRPFDLKDNIKQKN
jgi:hypothetical protein